MGDSYEAVIIGGGPAGLTAGIYLMRAGIKTVLFEKMMAGGAAMTSEGIENYPGFPDCIPGRELMERMAEQARRLGLEIKELSQVGGVAFKDGLFETVVDGGPYRSMGLIAAMGTEPAKLGVPGEAEFFGRGVSHCATCDGMFFKGLDVAVVGGGDTALSEAMTLANITGRVYVIHRRDRLRGQQILQDRVAKNEKIKLVLEKVVSSINGKGQVESVSLRDTKTGAGSELPVAAVFCYVGNRPDTAFLGDLVERDGAGFIVTDETMESKTKGLFAAGDVRKKPLRQIATAVGDGALAAVSLEKHVLERR